MSLRTDRRAPGPGAHSRALKHFRAARVPTPPRTTEYVAAFPVLRPGADWARPPALRARSAAPVPRALRLLAAGCAAGAALAAGALQSPLDPAAARAVLASGLAAAGAALAAAATGWWLRSPRRPARARATAARGTAVHRADLDLEACELLARLQSACHTILAAEVTRAGLVEARAARLLEHEWELACALREQSALRARLRSGAVPGSASASRDGWPDQARAAAERTVAAAERCAHRVRLAELAYRRFLMQPLAAAAARDALAEESGAARLALERDRVAREDLAALGEQAEAVREALGGYGAVPGRGEQAGGARTGRFGDPASS